MMESPDQPRARLLRYVLRPPLSQDRIASLPDHRVRLTLKRPWSDGTYALDMDALALLARLASAVPPPKTTPDPLCWCACSRGPLAPPDHSASPCRPASKCRPSATCVHQAAKATTFWHKMSLHQVVRASPSDLRLDRGPMPRVPGPHEATCSGTRPRKHQALLAPPRPVFATPGLGPGACAALPPLGDSP
jgi:hypothetical protein